MITGNGSGTVNRFAGVVEAQDTLKISLSEGQKVKEIFVEKRAGSGAWDETL